MGTINMFLVLMRKVPADWGRIVSDTERPLTFVKSRYLIAKYIPGYWMFICLNDSSGRQSNMKQKIRE